MRPGFDQVAGLWEDGRRRVAEAPPPLRAVLERVVDQLALELRRRVGVKFTADELAAYYLEDGTDWCYEIAYRTAPGSPEAWDMATVANAAFALYVRSATDYAGGQRLQQEE